MSAQSAIIPQPTPHGRFLVLNIRELPLDVLKKQLQTLETTRERLRGQNPDAGLVSSVAFGPDLWCRLHDAAPAKLKPLEPIEGKFTMPATGGDLFVHIQSQRADLCFALAFAFIGPIASQVEVMDERTGFKYMDGRDLTGFVDGTENPQTEYDRIDAALIGEEDDDFSHGSYVFVQRYSHQMDKWQRLKVDAQEHVIGRTKLESIELDEAEQPENSHVSRTVIEEDGEELAILRHSMPYGSSGGEVGLFFLAYTRDPSIIDRMLARMFGSSGDGLSDRLLNFVTPLTGAYFFAPAQGLLEEVIGLED